MCVDFKMALFTASHHNPWSQHRCAACRPLQTAIHDNTGTIHWNITVCLWNRNLRDMWPQMTFSSHQVAVAPRAINADSHFDSLTGFFGLRAVLQRVLTASSSSTSLLHIIVSILSRNFSSITPWLGKVICQPVALPSSTSANTPAEGNQRFHLRTESLWIQVTKPGRTPFAYKKKKKSKPQQKKLATIQYS